MSVKIRLARAGAKKRPYYKIVIADVRSPRDGRYIEQIGAYNPLLPKDHDERVKVNVERATYWLSKGAQPTDRVARFLNTEGLVKWKHGNNPNKGKPGEKALERVEERAEKEAALKEAAKEAKEAEKAAAAEAKEAEKAAAETASAEKEETPAKESPKEEAPAEEAPKEEAKSDD